MDVSSTDLRTAKGKKPSKFHTDMSIPYQIINPAEKILASKRFRI
jgi:hypothetical protein